jgi:hypothetical protein
MSCSIKHHGGAKFVVHIQDEAAHVLLFFHVHAGHGFVEQQHLWLQRQGTPQVHTLLQTVGQLAHGGFAVGAGFRESR